MKNKQSITYLILVFFIAAAMFGCKSSKKAATTTKTEPKEEPEKKETVITEEEPEKEEVKETSLEVKLDGYFEDIANASDINLANRNIAEVLQYFESKDTPVFIVFYREGGQKDYDRPTTIEKYLNYLKDQKKNPNRISHIVYNDAGKIHELELTTR